MGIAQINNRQSDVVRKQYETRSKSHIYFWPYHWLYCHRFKMVDTKQFYKILKLERFPYCDESYCDRVMYSIGQSNTFHCGAPATVLWKIIGYYITFGFVLSFIHIHSCFKISFVSAYFEFLLKLWMLDVKDSSSRYIYHVLSENDNSLAKLLIIFPFAYIFWIAVHNQCAIQFCIHFYIDSVLNFTVF